MRRNQQQVRNHVSDSVEHGIDELHRAADRCLVYPLAAIEGAIQGAARGVHNVVTQKHHLENGATCGSSSHPGKCKCKRKSKSKPHCSRCGHPVGSSTPYEFYSYPPAPPPPPPPSPQFQYHHQPTFPVPCRPPY
ncbi:hypothetical protein Gorai_016183 [Gossypium raimondii]|uniref:Uncharacterized protein n=1 Tax=Gossypium raimondii TaxID=29730 RepID=A0A0D2RA50_GOSRA|nr:hypothetical protein B456_005G066200 [Gossypium raimondii]MBA0585404.1 hypothetical protein [Gossypium raimondii]